MESPYCFNCPNAVCSLREKWQEKTLNFLFYNKFQISSLEKGSVNLSWGAPCSFISLASLEDFVSSHDLKAQTLSQIDWNTLPQPVPADLLACALPHRLSHQLLKYSISGLWSLLMLGACAAVSNPTGRRPVTEKINSLECNEQSQPFSSLISKLWYHSRFVLCWHVRENLKCCICI